MSSFYFKIIIKLLKELIISLLLLRIHHFVRICFMCQKNLISHL